MESLDGLAVLAVGVDEITDTWRLPRTDPVVLGRSNPDGERDLEREPRPGRHHPRGSVPWSDCGADDIIHAAGVPFGFSSSPRMRRVGGRISFERRNQRVFEA